MIQNFERDKRKVGQVPIYCVISRNKHILRTFKRKN